MGDFESWWRNDGSGLIPHAGYDVEEHAREVARAAWRSAVTAEREACARIADERAAAWPSDERWTDIHASVAAAIRNRSNTSK